MYFHKLTNNSKPASIILTIKRNFLLSLEQFTLEFIRDIEPIISLDLFQISNNF